MSSKIGLLLMLCLSSLAYARPKSVTVVYADSAIVFNKLELREQTTRAFLPGCSWPDILQGTGWFPATFYSHSPASVVDSHTVRFQLINRTALASYCGAVTDNVANSISFQYLIVETGREAYGSIPFTLGTSKETRVDVDCRYIQAKNEEHGQFYCDNASLPVDGELTIGVRLIKE